MNVQENKKSLPVANISNHLAFNLSWNLSFREWNVVLYLISKLDSKNQKSFEEQVVSIKELESILKSDGKKWGGLYIEIEKLRKRLMRKPIDFYTDVTIDGKPLTGGINFFEMIIPERAADNSVNLRFKFTGAVKPLLLQLNRHFVGIPQYKTRLIKNGHAIRFLIAAKAKRDMMRSHEEVSSLKYTLDDFKMLLGIPGMYADFRNFKRSVIKKIQDEINERCDFLEIVDVLYHPVKRKPKEEVEFLIKDINGGIPQQLAFLNKDWQPTEVDIESLSKAKLAAYNTLIDFGVNAGIVFRQILPLVTSTEFVGFEDWYFQEILKIFNTKTKKKKKDKQGRAGAFVNWILDTSFTQDQFPEVIESIIKRKKALQKDDVVAWDNRLNAKNMTAKEFDKSYLESKNKAK